VQEPELPYTKALKHFLVKIKIKKLNIIPISSLVFLMFDDDFSVYFVHAV
jgi:hypothetical protein